MQLFPGKRRLSRLSITRIKELIDEIEPDDTVIEVLSSDSRAGVRALACKLKNRKHRNEELHRKQESLLEFERRLKTQGKNLIAGVDEAGRGPLAGPVVAAAVILPDNVDLHGLDDSKKMTAKCRNELFDKITSQAIAWGIGMAENDEIDEIGILEATMKAMCTAVENLHTTPDVVLVDGNRSPELPYDTRAIVDGDALSLSIAAASVLAKVSRDRIMVDMDRVFPGYGFARHKGYGASVHVDALRRKGPCDIHRFSFRIVPDVSPKATVLAVLKKRLLNAPNREFLERSAAGIARIREHLPKSCVESLRDVYRKRLHAIKKTEMSTGKRGEEESCDYLVRKGYSILDRNWRSGENRYELDIVAQIESTIVFCEVKTATTGQFGDPLSWVTPKKTERISQAAIEYISKHSLSGCSYRFDIIGLRKKGDTFEIVHMKNAFSAPEVL